MEPIQREIDLLKTSNNEFVLKYLDSFYLESTVGKVYFIVTQFYPDETLHHLISRKCAINEPFHSDTLKKYSKQLLNGIEYLHSINIIHRDLKPNNIFINGPNLVIGDLGHAKKFQNSVSKKSFSFRFGTLPYNSPESIESENIVNYTKKIDIWLVYYKYVFVYCSLIYIISKYEIKCLNY